MLKGRLMSTESDKRSHVVTRLQIKPTLCTCGHGSRRHTSNGHHLTFCFECPCREYRETLGVAVTRAHREQAIRVFWVDIPVPQWLLEWIETGVGQFQYGIYERCALIIATAESRGTPGVTRRAWAEGYAHGYDDREKMDHDRADVLQSPNPYPETEES